MGLCASKNHPVNPNEASPTAPAAGSKHEARHGGPSGSSLTTRGSLLNVDESTLQGSARINHRYRVARSHKHFQGKGRPDSPSTDSEGGMLSEEQRKLVSRIVEQSPVFTNVSEAMLDGLLREFVPVEVHAQEVIFTEGDDSDLFFIVASGTLESQKGGGKPKVMEAGATLGEDALRLRVRACAAAGRAPAALTRRRPPRVSARRRRRPPASARCWPCRASCTSAWSSSWARRS